MQLLGGQGNHTEDDIFGFASCTKAVHSGLADGIGYLSTPQFTGL